ncbi:hypothetical protein [Campylobacter lari]|uniref:hypothetical protein n=1 Tax=Campylobacter lari TaxID=201 RepID=UPI002157B21A|nr:hypothetical protein [Campylobacter lari]MCR6775060.1 hypothetical protein [Campylobacter lari]
MITNDQIFDECVKIHETIINNREAEAKEKILCLLDKIKDKSKYPPILNHLLRQLGMYSYMNENTSILTDRIALECFKIKNKESKSE